MCILDLKNSMKMGIPGSKKVAESQITESCMCIFDFTKNYKYEKVASKEFYEITKKKIVISSAAREGAARR
jgi:hypothetical protein